MEVRSCDYLRLGKNLCNPTFEPTSFYPIGSTDRINSAVIGDFNNDDQIDIAISIFTYTMCMIYVLLGNNNGTFQPPIGSEIDLVYKYVTNRYLGHCEARFSLLVLVIFFIFF